MRIEHVLIHNFRGVIHQEFTLNPYTLLIGGNNAGKSTVIGFYLVDHAKVISVNNNENWKRMLAYNIIWVAL
jgi:predicted ATPase